MSCTIPENTKFACLALQDVRTEGPASAPVAVNETVEVHFESPFALDEIWTKWLGTIRADALRASKLLIVSKSPSGEASSLNALNAELEWAVTDLYYGLLVLNMGHGANGLIFSGGFCEGEESIRSISDLERTYLAHGAKPLPVRHAAFHEAALIAKGLKDVRENTQAYPRLSRGVRALIRGFREKAAWDRLHEFVRALEAVICPDIGKTTRQFKHRASILAGQSPNTPQAIDELYELRSCTEHMNDWQRVLSGYTDPGPVADLRAYQAQWLATCVYARVLKSVDFRNRFRDDTTARAFWDRADHEVMSEWGKPVDFGAAGRNMRL
jgi:hypothetical protein